MLSSFFCWNIVSNTAFYMYSNCLLADVTWQVMYQPIKHHLRQWLEMVGIQLCTCILISHWLIMPGTQIVLDAISQNQPMVDYPLPHSSLLRAVYLTAWTPHVTHGGSWITPTSVYWRPRGTNAPLISHSCRSQILHTRLHQKTSLYGCTCSEQTVWVYMYCNKCLSCPMKGAGSDAIHVLIKVLWQLLSL